MNHLFINCFPSTKCKALQFGVCFIFIWFFLGGIAHFVATDLEMRIVPPYIPWPRAVVLLTGVLELCGAVGLLWQPTQYVSGWSLFALTVAVTPANVFMLQRHDLFTAIPYWALVARLPLQLALLALIAWIMISLRQRQMSVNCTQDGRREG